MPLDLNEAARCVAIMVVDAGVDAAVVEQQQRRLDAAHLGGEVERRVAVVVDTVEHLRGAYMRSRHLSRSSCHRHSRVSPALAVPHAPAPLARPTACEVRACPAAGPCHYNMIEDTRHFKMPSKVAKMPSQTI